MSLEQEGLSGPNQAWTLYMAGSSFDQIAEVLDIDPEDVPDLLRVVVEQLAEARGTSPAQLDLNAELDLERVNELFQTVYAKALMTNEPEHQKFALQLMSFRRRLQAKVAHVPIPDPETAPSHKQVRAAWQILAGGAPVVAQALVDIAANGYSETARVQAATAVLDRVGVTPVQRSEVAVHLMDSSAPDETGQIQTPGQIVRQRLAAIAARKPVEAHSDDGFTYIDAEED